MARAVLAVAFLAALSTAVVAQTAVDKARQARTMWSAFQCSIYAEMSGNQREQGRLFEVGLQAGRAFLDAVKKKEIPDEVASREIPVMVTFLLQGPTPDFVIGRVYESAADDAFAEIVKKQNGIPLEPPKWINDPTHRKLKAETQYTQQNCILLK